MVILFEVKGMGRSAATREEVVMTECPRILVVPVFPGAPTLPCAEQRTWHASAGRWGKTQKAKEVTLEEL